MLTDKLKQVTAIGDELKKLTHPSPLVKSLLVSAQQGIAHVQDNLGWAQEEIARLQAIADAAAAKAVADAQTAKAAAVAAGEPTVLPAVASNPAKPASNPAKPGLGGSPAENL
jgi:hypothetical protein